jgi:hypothetical protein
MASTIKLKNGSGAPTTGDLVQGEPALDLTNKRLYTENASGVVIEVGTNPTSITTGNITANGTINLTGATVSNAGSITTADINGGTIDGTVIGGSTAAAITGTTITGTSFVSSGDMTFGDSDKAIFGAGSDLQIYHDGSHSIIADAGSGNLQIRANDFQLLNAANTQNIIRGYDATGAVSLHYGGAEKLATSSSGVYVTGTVTADGLDVDTGDAGNGLNYGFDVKNAASGSATSYAMPAISWSNGGLRWASVHGERNPAGGFGGSFVVNTMNSAGSAVKRLGIDLNGDISFYEDTGTTAKFFWDASAESLGIGTSSPASFFSGANQLVVGSGSGSQGITIYSSSSDNAQIFFSDGTTGDQQYRGILRYDHNADAMTFLTAGANERMRIDSSGNVQQATSVNGDLFHHIYNANTGTSAEATLYVSNGSVVSGLFAGATGTNFTTTGGFVQDGAHIGSGGGAVGGLSIITRASAPIRFYTNGHTNERMRIDSSGNLLVAGTAVLQSAKMSVHGSVAAENSAADGGYQNAFVSVYSVNNDEHNAIRTAVSSTASGSGFQFMVSDGGGSSGTTESFRINRTSCTVIGSLSKGSGSFKIDHPLKPETHHLVHSFVESPQADNIYRGKVELVAGRAEVNIDTISGMTEGTFVALNREVQCFTSNESDWDAVRGFVTGNILTIECQNAKSTATTSWLVIGERQDQHMYDTDWTDKNGKVIVEPLKQTETLEAN